MTTLREAAQAVLDRWDSPRWKWSKHGPTADLMADLRAALAAPVQESVQESVRLQCTTCGTVYADGVPPQVPVQEPVAWMHVPYPGNGMSPLVSRSEQREPSMYAASVPLYLKEQL